MGKLQEQGSEAGRCFLEPGEGEEEKWEVEQGLNAQLGRLRVAVMCAEMPESSESASPLPVPLPSLPFLSFSLSLLEAPFLCRNVFSQCK